MKLLRVPATLSLMSRKRSPTWAATLGTGLAYVQHTMDSAFLWGFRQLRKAGSGKQTPKRRKDSATLHEAKRVGKGLLAFFGEIGDSYFEAYGRLKSRR